MQRSRHHEIHWQTFHTQGIRLHRLDVLRPVLGADERGPGRVDDDQIGAADRGDQVLGVFAGDERVFAIDQVLTGRGDGVVAFVRPARLGEAGPTAHVQPGERHRHRGDGHRLVPAGRLHDRKVDADLLQLRVDLVEHLVLLGGAPRLGDPGDLCGVLRGVFLNAPHHRGRLPDKHAAVPQVLLRTGGKVSFRDLLLGLFFELINDERVAVDRFTELEVAVAGGRLSRRDAEGHQRVLLVLGQGKALLHDRSELILGGDQVVGGEHGDHRGGVQLADHRGGQRYGVERVAAHRLGDVVRLGKARQRFEHRGLVTRAGTDVPLLGRDQALEPLERNLQQRPAGDEGNQLFGLFRTAHRPQPRARTARHNQCVSHAR